LYNLFIIQTLNFRKNFVGAKHSGSLFNIPNHNLYTGMQRRPEPGKGEAFRYIG